MNAIKHPKTLGLVAVGALVALVALAGIAVAVVCVPFLLVRTITRSLHSHIAARPRTAPALPPVRHHQV